MSLHIHTDYYQDELEVRYCTACMKSFIVGKEIAKIFDNLAYFLFQLDMREDLIWRQH